MGKAVSLERRTTSVGQRPDRSVDEAIPPIEEWDRMMAEIDSDRSRRAWISHEFAAEASNAMAQKFATSLGERIHVVITLRSPAEILPSLWTQRLKAGQTDTFDDWLKRVFNQVPDQPMRRQFRRSQNQGALVERWASIVGADNVTVIVVDKSRPTLLLHTFERMLGLRDEMLTTASTSGSRLNRSLSLPEAELFMRINSAAKSESLGWADYATLIRGGAVPRMLDNRVPPIGEPRVLMPAWAADLARDRGRKYARRIKKSGVRIVGDLRSLSAAVPTRDGEESAIDSVPMDVAVEAVLGTLVASIDKGVFERATDRSTKQRALILASRLIRVADTHTSGDLVHYFITRVSRSVTAGAGRLRRRGQPMDAQ